ncbi:MAG: hypothetical protein AAGG44_07870, partial [Planctomycetota bacterium]
MAARRLPCARRGLTTAELLVSAILLAATVSVVATGAVNMRRVQKQGDHYRSAVDFLSSVLAESESVADENLETYLAQLEVPNELQSQFGSEVSIEGRMVSDTRGQQVHLELHLDPQANEQPIRLVGFRYQSPRNS